MNKEMQSKVKEFFEEQQREIEEVAEKAHSKGYNEGKLEALVYIRNSLHNPITRPSGDYIEDLKRSVDEMIKVLYE